MHTDDLYIYNDKSCVNVLTTYSDVEANDIYCSTFNTPKEFRDAVIEHHKYAHCIRISVKYNKSRILPETVRRIEEQVLYISDSLTVASSPIHFYLMQKVEEDEYVHIIHNASEITEELIRQYESFEIFLFVDFSSDVFAVVECIARLNQCLEEIREVTYNSSTVRFGRYFADNGNYMYLITKGTQYAFDWCSFQNELFKNSEMSNPLHKTRLLTLLLIFLKIFPENKENYVRLRIYDYISRYSRRKLIKQ